MQPQSPSCGVPPRFSLGTAPELPVRQASTVELIIDMKTAKALGLMHATRSALPSDHSIVGSQQ